MDPLKDGSRAAVLHDMLFVAGQRNLFSSLQSADLGDLRLV